MFMGNSFGVMSIAAAPARSTEGFAEARQGSAKTNVKSDRRRDMMMRARFFGQQTTQAPPVIFEGAAGLRCLCVSVLVLLAPPGCDELPSDMSRPKYELRGVLPVFQTPWLADEI